MRRTGLPLIAMLLATVFALLAEPPLLGLTWLLLFAFDILRWKLHGAILGLGILIQAPLLGLLLAGPGDPHVGLLGWSSDGAWLAVQFSLRLAVLLGVNLLLVSLVAWEQLRLGPILQPHADAIGLIVHRLRMDVTDAARALHGGKLARVRQISALLPFFVLRSLQISNRHNLVRGFAGIPAGSKWVPIWGLTALAIVARLGMAWLPNVSLIFLVVASAGMLFGLPAGLMVAAVSMVATNLFLSGFAPSGFTNVVPMMGVAMLAAWRPSRSSGAVPAFIFGALVTIAFSIASDVGDWAILPELRGNFEVLRIRIVSGLIFNIVPAILHGLLFAAAWPVLCRHREWIRDQIV